MAKKYKDQDYFKFKKGCQDLGILYDDKEFPPNHSSLSSDPDKFENVVWKRPGQICTNPKMLLEGGESGSVTQGQYGKSWFMAAASSLFSLRQAWQKVIPDHKGQEWDDKQPEKYKGIFRFNIWRFGEWLEVIVDDFLPTINDKLVFTHSQYPNELWSALLEKAYAKLFGSYEILGDGNLEDTLADFTGGVSYILNLQTLEINKKQPERLELFAKMEKDKGNSLMAARLPPNTEEEFGESIKEGIVKGHVYIITAVKYLNPSRSGLLGFNKGEKMSMVRLKNPWSTGAEEWNGAFSDSWANWDLISKEERKLLELSVQGKGEFWMTFDDFCIYFVETYICILVNTSFFSMSRQWHEGVGHGRWEKPQLAGGGQKENNVKFLLNPQYTFDVAEKSELMVDLIQKSKMGTREINDSIGFTLLKVELNREERMHNLVLQEQIASTPFQCVRSVFLCRCNLKKGRYAVIPSTLNPGVERDFLLRVYTENSNGFKELKRDEHRFQTCFCCYCVKPASLVTHIRIIGAEGLEKNNNYVVLKCEGQTVTTRSIKNTTSPQWDQCAVFYRQKPKQSPLEIQIWNSNTLSSEFVGKYVFDSTEDCQQESIQGTLVGEKDVTKPGVLSLVITQSGDSMAI